MWQARIVLFHDPLDQRTHMLRTLCHDNAEFGEVAEQGVDQGGALANLKFAGPMQHQNALLLGALHRHKAHRRSLYCFTDGLGIGCVILLAFHIGLHIDRWNQPHVMAQLLEFARPVMRRCTGLKADQARIEFREEAENLATPQLAT